MSVLAVIPARGGSKRVPRKNLRPLGGRALIAWSIQAGLDARLVDRVVVSTEDAEIADVAQGWGADVVWRPPELATDEALTDPVLLHALETNQAGIVVLLQPTVPLRPAGLVDRCIERLMDTGADAVHTVERASHHFVWWEEEEYSSGGGPVRRRWVTQCPRRPRRQDMHDREVMLLENGSVTATRAQLLRDTGSRLGIVVTGGRAEYRGRIECVETERTIDIDTEADLVAAEALLAAERATA